MVSTNTSRSHRGASRGRSKHSRSGSGNGRHGLSTGSKVAIASAAGVLAATAAGLATTRKGRAFTRKVGRKVSPMLHDRLGDVINTIESTLAEHGVLDMIPTTVRKKIHQKLGVPMQGAASTRASSTRPRSTGSAGSRSRQASAG